LEEKSEIQNTYLWHIKKNTRRSLKKQKKFYISADRRLKKAIDVWSKLGWKCKYRREKKISAGGEGNATQQGERDGRTRSMGSE